MSGQIPEQRPGRATAGVPGGSSVYGASAGTGSQGLATVAAAVDPTCERGEEKSVVEVGVNASGMPFSGPAGTHAPSRSRHSPPGRVHPGQRRATPSGTGRHMIDEGQWEGWLVVDRLEGRISVSVDHQEPSSVVASSVARGRIGGNVPGVDAGALLPRQPTAGQQPAADRLGQNPLRPGPSPVRTDRRPRRRPHRRRHAEKGAGRRMVDHPGDSACRLATLVSIRLPGHLDGFR